MDYMEKALHYYRNLVYCIYREIRVFKPGIFDKIYEKINISAGFFDRVNGLQMANTLYHETVTKTSTSAIVLPYKSKTGLSVRDLRTIYDKGNWNSRPAYGGYKWAMITQKTMELENAIDQKNSQDIFSLLNEIDALNHNTGQVTNKFHPYPFVSK